jgi:RNA recognition motif-containing protein
MGKKLYVGSISFNASEEDLIKLFSTIGEVESAKIITDANTGQSKGFAFIEMASEEDAKKAITDLNGASFMERTIVVNEARPKPPREKRDFGGGRGGFDRGRGGAGGYGNSKGRGSAGPGRRGRR